MAGKHAVGRWDYEVLGNTVVICGTGAPPDDDYDATLELHRTDRVTRGIVFAVGSASVSADQRKRTLEAMRDHPSLVITDSAITRGIVTALSWFGSPMSACSPDTMASAIAKFGAPRGHTVEDVIAALDRLRSRLERDLAERRAAI